MRTKDDKFAVCHEDLWRLVGVDGGEEGINGIGNRGDVLLTLLLVEEEELAVTVTQLGGCGLSGAVRGQLAGQRMVRRRDPVRHVIVYWPADFLFKPLKLFDLKKKQKQRSNIGGKVYQGSQMIRQLAINTEAVRNQVNVQRFYKVLSPRIIKVMFFFLKLNLEF